MYRVLLFLFMTSCLQTCYQKLSNNPLVEAQKICMTADGSGRMNIGDESFQFSYESLLEQRENRFALAMNFPFIGEEFFEMTWQDDDIKLNSELETRILQQSSKVEAESLHTFITLWSEFLKDIIELKQNKKKALFFDWKIKNNELVAKSSNDQRSVEGKFFYARDNVFTRMEFTHKDKKSEKTSSFELIVSKCLNKPDN
jgi:hypothetical protein